MRAISEESCRARLKISRHSSPKQGHDATDRQQEEMYHIHDLIFEYMYLKKLTECRRGAVVASTVGREVSRAKNRQPGHANRIKQSVALICQNWSS